MSIMDITSISNTVQDTIATGREMLTAGLTAAKQVLPQILPAAASALASVSYRGTQGSFVDIGRPVVLASKFMQVAPENRANYGRPLYATRRLSNLSGFVLCLNPQIEIGGSIEEETAIIEMLSSGIYIE